MTSPPIAGQKTRQAQNWAGGGKAELHLWDQKGRRTMEERDDNSEKRKVLAGRKGVNPRGVHHERQHLILVCPHAAKKCRVCAKS